MIDIIRHKQVSLNDLQEGEYVIKRDAVNGNTLDMLEYINKHGDLPMSDARKRRK